MEKYYQGSAISFDVAYFNADGTEGDLEAKRNFAIVIYKNRGGVKQVFKRANPATGEYQLKKTNKNLYVGKLPGSVTKNLEVGIYKIEYLNSFVFGDPDAEAFIVAAGITNNVHKSAVTNLVKALKNSGIWTKCVAIYPIVGGTAANHKYNLKDPRNLDDAYRLVFNGSITHDSNGMKGDGLTGYANTNLNSNTLTNGNTHLAFYSRTNQSRVEFEIGVRGSTQA